jgi:hypothetical protein
MRASYDCKIKMLTHTKHHPAFYILKRLNTNWHNFLYSPFFKDIFIQLTNTPSADKSFSLLHTCFEKQLTGSCIHGCRQLPNNYHFESWESPQSMHLPSSSPMPWSSYPSHSNATMWHDSVGMTQTNIVSQEAMWVISQAGTALFSVHYQLTIKGLPFSVFTTSWQ